MILVVDVSKRIAIGVLVGLFAAGCGAEPSDLEWGFGEGDMQNAIVGNWDGSMSLSGKMPMNFSLAVTRAPSLQPACGSRTFSAPACVETSTMNLEAMLTTQDQTFENVKLTGSYMIIGLELDNGELSLTGPGINLYGGIDVNEPQQSLGISGNQMGSAVMKRQDNPAP